MKEALLVCLSVCRPSVQATFEWSSQATHSEDEEILSDWVYVKKSKFKKVREYNLDESICLVCTIIELEFDPPIDVPPCASMLLLLPII